LDAFVKSLQRQRGEVKSVLTRQSFVAGIGNAYADEICWRAGLYPFRRRSSLDEREMKALYRAMRDVLIEATAAIRQQIGPRTDVEVRGFLSVHGHPGEPCPRCGSAISEVKRERRATHFCRTCQPGLMLGGLRR
jgi:formamidopyrimidine-DNA glycosylase